ncbi:2-(1,2-epoxy-1,2-dihydrophenyl)acetyl-CoA isomerase PaaG [Acidocella aromatica]|uniref:2-(1,2-epoxy-1,2-dihydrophenyl)acetyl-CoA isomerase n=1 Tax=Acidocella aromatica TaxID=1303579 RepID=A0A840VRX6_9PROT|nr:2-(1,2-epoxy-1,2-dihydrophenyl)acetyl-CoA isomerase [Acidocella aromatica]
MAFETILFSITDGVGRLTLNRPERLNSFTVRMHQEVAEALSALEAAPDMRVLLLTGAGRGFCAGQDLADRAVTPGESVDLGDSVERFYNPLIRRLVALPFPVVCAVNGVAAGAGASIALAGDIVIAARSAKFIQSFANIGLIPDSGGTWVLPRLAGQARALGMALTGKPISATQAAEWGLIWEAVEDDALGATVEALLAQFQQAPTAGLAATKQMIRASWLHSLDEELDLERDTMRRLGRTADYQEGVAAFIAKRKPNFQGR